jgi:hypothetical protein
MTTASNSINTDSIDRITSGILTIGGVATDVSMTDTTTQVLTVTGRTTSGIQAERIGMTYTTISNLTDQRARQLFLPVSSGAVNAPIVSGVITTVVSNNTGPTLMTIALPIGVWSVSYTIKYRPNNSAVNVDLTYMMTTLTLDTPVTYDGVNYFPKYLGLQAVPFAIRLPLDSALMRSGMSGNAIITNNVEGNILRLQFQMNGVTVDGNNRVAPFVSIEGQQSGLPQTFMIATRIA